MQRIRSHRGATALALALLLPGAARGAEQREHRERPDLAARLSALHRIGIVAPEVKVFELTASNQPVFRPDWSEKGREAVTASLEAALRARGLEPARFEPASTEAKEELREVTELYQAVVSGVVQATFTNQFPSKVSGFEYSVGDLGPLLDAQQLDGVVLAFGTGAASSGGRKAVQTLSAIFAGVASSGVDRLLVGLFDRRGDLLWFGIFASTGYDLRDPDSAAHFVEVLTGDLPAVKR